MNRQKICGCCARRIASILAVSAQAFGLVACGKTEAPPPAGQSQESSVEQLGRNGAAPQARNRADGQGAQDGTKQNEKQDDARITAQVVARLDKDPELAASKIDVGTVDGKVTLDGPAPSTIARDRAETMARAVSGVTEVNNQLLVTARSGSSS